MLQEIATNTIANLLSSAIILALAVTIYRQYKIWRFGGWQIVIRRGRHVLAQRAISPRKAEQILEESSDLSVYVKGVASPFSWLKGDVLEMVIVDRKARIILLNLPKENNS